MDYGGQRHEGKTQSLYRGDAFRALIDRMRPQFDAQARRAAATLFPGIRVADYVEAQASPLVRQSLSWLIGGRSWRYVSFAEFRQTLGALSAKLFEDLGLLTEANAKAKAKGQGHEVCFVVDSFDKSSFWVVALAISMAPEGALPYGRMSLAVDDHPSLFGAGEGGGGGLHAAFAGLPRDARLVLMDDATYSGDQLSYFHDAIVQQWAEANGSRARVHVAVPYMSTPSLSLFKRRRAGTSLSFGLSFPSLFQGRTLASVLASDVYLLRDSVILQEYQSLFFDFVGVLPTNTLILFDHKVADSLSVPNRWLQLGPCLQRQGPQQQQQQQQQGAMRLRADAVDELVRLLRRDVRRQPQQQMQHMLFPGGPGTPSQRAILAASRRVCELMNSPQFCERFAERVSLAADRPYPPPYMPLIPPEFCDARYRRYVQTRLRRAPSAAAADGVPPCRRPPYKRTSFRRGIRWRRGDRMRLGDLPP